MILSCSLPLSAIQTGDEIKTVEAFTKSKAFSSKSYQANL